MKNSNIIACFFRLAGKRVKGTKQVKSQTKTYDFINLVFQVDPAHHCADFDCTNRRFAFLWDNERHGLFEHKAGKYHFVYHPAGAPHPWAKTPELQKKYGEFLESEMYEYIGNDSGSNDSIIAECKSSAKADNVLKARVPDVIV